MTSRFGPTLRFKGCSHALSAGSIAEVNRDGALLKRVDKNRVLSGIGEGPAIVHLRNGGLPSFTTRFGCVTPTLSQALFSACREGNWDLAETLRTAFLPLEDLRDEFGPAQVLHTAMYCAGTARTGPLPPYVSAVPGAPPHSDSRSRPYMSRSACRTHLFSRLIGCTPKTNLP